ELDAASVLLVELARDPGASPGVFLRLAEIHVERNDLSKAVKTLRDGLERPAKEPKLSLFLSRILLKLDQFKEAQAALERARADGGSDKDVAMLMGMCLGHQNDLAGAEREFQRAMDAGYDPKAVKYNLAIILTQRGEYARAKEMLLEVLALDPKWNEARRELAHAMLLADQDAVNVNKALDMLIDVKDDLKDDWHVFEYIGDAWLLLGDSEAAVAAYTDALRLGKNPKSVEDKYVVAKRKWNEVLEKKKAEGAGSEAAKQSR
ncbi:MAG: tetratricopeptide repeat protein, partial [Planctomycetes bacterium]|nr:tetratricopeptide repeat protein [Planctomycetota bacterium]